MSPKLFTRMVGCLYTLWALAALSMAYVAGPSHSPAGPTLAVGMLPLSPAYNLVHLIVGLVAVLACRNVAASVSVSCALAIFLGFTAVVGLLPPQAASASSLGLISTDGIWPHAVTALLAAYVGFAPMPRRPSHRQRICGAAVPA